MKRSKKKHPMRFHVISLFPESFSSYLDTSILGRAQREGHLKVFYYNPRDYAEPKSQNQKKRARPFVAVDDRPFGGGPGMVMKPEPVLKAIRAAEKRISRRKKLVVFFDAGGEQFTNELAARYVGTVRDIVLVCGRYEGIDARVAAITKAVRLSVGPYVLTGGELPALIVMDTVARWMPGVLGNDLSVEERRVSAHDVYTRPETLVWKKKKYRVPAILRSGNHARIRVWKQGK